MELLELEVGGVLCYFLFAIVVILYFTVRCIGSVERPFSIVHDNDWLWG